MKIVIDTDKIKTSVKETAKKAKDTAKLGAWVTEQKIRATGAIWFPKTHRKLTARKFRKWLDE